MLQEKRPVSQPAEESLRARTLSTPQIASRSVAPGVAPRSSANATPGVSVLGLWAAFRRWWYPVFPFSILLAGGLAYLGWSLMANHTASAYLRVDSSDRPLIFTTADETAGSRTDFRLFKNTQQQLIKLPFVLNAALRKAEVESLPEIKSQSAPLDWLQDNLKVTFPADSEIMQVSLETANSESCRKIVNAIVEAYLSEVVLNERNEKLQRLDNLELVYSEAETKVRSKQGELKQMASDLGTSDSESLTVAQQNALQQFGLMQEKLSEIKYQLMQAEGQYKVAKEFEDRMLAEQNKMRERTDSAAGSDELEINKTPDIVKLEDEVELMEARLANLADGWGSKHPGVRKVEQELSTRKQILEKRKKEAREMAARQPKGALIEMDSTGRDNRSMFDMVSLTAKIEVFKNQEAILQQEVNKLSVETRQLGSTSYDIELMRSEIKGLESVLLRVGEEIERTGIELKTAPRIRVVSNADVSTPPDLKKRALLAVGLGVFGLVLPLGLAMFWDLSRKKLDDPDMLPQHLALRNLGGIPLISSNPLDLDSNKQRRQRSILRESVHSIAAMLMHRMDMEASRVFLVTSAMPSEGKSTVACQLSRSLAAAGKKVLLIDFDLRRPSVHRFLGLSQSPGVSEILIGRIAWPEALRELDRKGLYALTAGDFALHLQQMVSNGSVESLFNDLRNNFDVVIVDACPVLPVVDAMLISGFVDGVILTLRRGVSRLPAIARACEQLKSFGAPLIGSVVVGASGAQYGYYGYQSSQPTFHTSLDLPAIAPPQKPLHGSTAT